MATIVAAPPTLSGELALFHTTDPLLGNSPVLVFHGPAATVGATSSRIQVHVLTPAGLGSYARLSVSPNSPFYTAVSNLPREEQGDEVCRGLAFGLKKYFAELSEEVKKTWCAQAKSPSPGALFGDDHIAILATRMTRIENVDEVVRDVSQAFSEQRLSWLDADVILPPGTIREPDQAALESPDEAYLLKRKFGRYAHIVQCFGDSAFLPTSKMKRAPSKANTIGRSASFLKHHKENVRKELTELANTEESYVGRLRELQQLSENLGTDLKARHQSQLREVFSPAIGKILSANSAFLDSIRCLLESTEIAAQKDTENTSSDQTSAQQIRQDFLHDTQGVGAIARCLLEWFPQFSECYMEYMTTQAQSSLTLRALLRNNDTLTAQLQEVGEQKLTSLLIEPVQRLPRYNLYIDSIAKQLPMRHPALKPLLKARDIITEICAETEGSQTATIIERLCSRTSGWPADIKVTGRLVSALDYVELRPPYVLESSGSARGILLLFTDGIIMVEKTGVSTTSARTLLTEIESGSLPVKSGENLHDTAGDLRFIRRLQLDAVHCTESHDGQALQLLTFFELPSGAMAAQEPKLDSLQVLRLENSYDGKATRIVEEICKARIERRFSEQERESAHWEFRATAQAPETLALFSAVFDDSRHDIVSARNGKSAVRIVVDIDKHAARPRAGTNGVRTVIALSPTRDGLWGVSVDSLDGSFGREHVEITEVLPNICRKLATLGGVRLAIEQKSMTSCLLGKNLNVLQSIELQAAPHEGEEHKPQLAPRERFHRPKSPKKLLSSLLSSVGPGSEPPHLRKELPSLPPPHTNIPRMPPPAHPKPPSRESRPSSKDQSTPRSMSSMRSTEQLSSPYRKLEETLSAYILALQARKGNLVGRNIKMRIAADELSVNELYNSLLEDPNMMVLAAQAPVDVLFAAFEKFLNAAWKEQVGQVLPYAVMQDIQSKAETLFPADFDAFFKTAIGRLAPQNQRAFKSIMRLLTDLLDGTGNDGDRGILTAAFAEILVTDGNPHHFIALIDRFVDDPDTYFGEPLDDSQRQADGLASSHKRTRSVNTASISSNTSSLRKKFGFGTLSRENSKSESESKVASVWRTLSKSSRVDVSPGNSISRGILNRSHSTDTDLRAGFLARPVSRDGSKLSSLGESFQGRTPSTQNLGLSTIGEHPSFIPTGPPRKKRRSSLSDLKALAAANKLEPYSPPSARRPPAIMTNLDDKSLPNSPVPSTPSSRGGSGRFGTPSQGSPRSRLPASFRKENSPGANRILGMAELRPKSTGNALDDSIMSPRPLSNIPSLTPKPLTPHRNSSITPARTGLSERPGAGNMAKKPSPSPEKITQPRSIPAPTSSTPTTSPAKKLRMQSPQKLRERLQTEQTAVATASTALQDELSKIGDELTASPSRMTSIRASKISAPGRLSASHYSTNTAVSSSGVDLAARVLKMEHALPARVAELTTRIAALQDDLTSSLAVSEAKCRKLDDLYREANGENEALYARFNDELGRVLRAVKSGEGGEEVRKTLRESQEEAAGLRRENGRLKRENVGLRAQLRE